VLPCHCGIIDTADYSGTKTEMLCLHSGDDTNHELDICTPFCSCANIHYPNFIEQSNTIIELTNLVSVKQYPIYNDNDTSPFMGTLWRPPQA